MAVKKPVAKKEEAPEVAEEATPVVAEENKQPELGDDVAIAVVSPMGNVIGKADEVIPQPDKPVAKARYELPSGNIREDY